MSDERRDADAATKQFLATFEAADKAEEERLKKIFLNRFLKTRKEVRQQYGAIPIGLDIMTNYREKVIFPLEHAMVKVRFEGSPEQEAGELADALALMLCAVEQLNLLPDIPDEVAQGRALALTKMVAKALRERGRKVRPTFIQRRIEQIATQHAGKLSSQKKKLLASMAAQFV